MSGFRLGWNNENDLYVQKNVENLIDAEETEYYCKTRKQDFQAIRKKTSS